MHVLASAPPWLLAGEVAAACSALAWAIAGIVFARLHPGLSAGALNLGKNLAGCLCFAVFLFLRDGTGMPLGVEGEALLFLVLAGVIGLGICDIYLLRSLMAIGPQRMSLIFCLAPVLVALGALLPPFREHPGALTWLGMGICLGGIVLAIVELGDPRTATGDVRQGVRDAIIAAVLQAVAVLLTRHAMQSASVDIAAAATVRLYAGTVALILIGLVGRRLVAWYRQLRHPWTPAKVFGAATLGTFIGIWLQQLGISWAANTGVATTLNALTPIYLLPLSALFLGERRRPIAWIATAVALGGIALMALDAGS